MCSILLIYSTDLRGKKIGGLETYVRDFARYLPEDVNLRVVGIDTVGDLEIGKWILLEYFGRKVFFFPVLYETDDGNSSKWFPLTLRFVLRTLRYQKRIFTQRETMDMHRIEHSLPLVILRRRFPIVQMIHGSSEHLLSKGGTKLEYFRRVFFWLERIILKNSHKIILVSHEGYEYYVNRFPSIRDRFIELSTWVDTELYSPTSKKNEIRRSKGLPIDAVVMIFAGRIHDVKDPLLMLQTLLEVRKSNPKAVFAVAGPGHMKEFAPSNPEYQELLTHVYEFGILRDEELAEFYNLGDLFLLTSKYEGMPRCVLEALASGLPTVTVAVGGVKTIIQNELNGCVVDSRDPKHLAAAVCRVMSSLAAMSIHARRSVEKYSAKEIVHKIVNMHKELYKAMPNGL